ncbi:MAG: magnesium transporter CorA family protein [Thermodesulfovibrionales bacterium]|jgi:magnesium transporter|nr:magnesium transporter CorA family protein [Thermodesulfovibrionales bacterium]
MTDYHREGEGISSAGVQELQLKSIKGKNFVWINIDNPTPSILNSLLEMYHFHHLDVEDCISKTQLPKIDEYKDYLFIILHFPRYLKEKKFSIPSQVGIFLGRDFLVTVHSGELKPINRIFQNCKKDEEAHDEYMGCSPTFLLYEIVHALIENIMLMLRRVISEIEEIEDKVFDEKTDAVREVTELRHNIANIRRVVSSLRVVVHDLEKMIHKFSNGDIGVYFSDLSDYIDKAWAILEECKETIEIYKDTDFIISSDRTNKILALLTIVFTLSIPATILGTFFGMNVNVPGGTGNPWTFMGPYTTFWVIVIVSILPVFLMYIVFKRLRWL